MVGAFVTRLKRASKSHNAEPSTYSQTRSLLTAIFLALVCYSCDSDGVDPAENARYNSTAIQAFSGAEQTEKFDADRDWSTIYSTSVQVPKSSKPLIDYVVRTELLRQAFWRAGNRFWVKYPDDPRRVVWLQIAVRTGPFFPQSIEDYAERDAALLGDCVLRNQAQLEEWVETVIDRVSELRAKSKLEVAELQRLDYGVATAFLVEAQRALHCTSAQDSQFIVRKALDATILYLQDHDETDVAEVQEQYRSHSADLVLGVKAVRANSGTAWDVFSRFDKSIGDLRSGLVAASEDSIDSPGTTEPNGKSIAEAISELVSRRRLPRYGKEYDQAFTYFFRQMISSRMHLELGIKYWNQLSDDEKLNWYQAVVGSTFSTYAFAENPYDAAAVLVADSSDSYATDDSRWKEWYEIANRYRQYIWAEFELDDAWYVALRGFEVRSLLADARFRDARTGGGDEVEQMLTQVHELYTKYNNEDMARRIASGVVSNADYYGLSESRVIEFLDPMANYQSDQLRSLYEGRARREALRKTPVQISLPHLSGEKFDIASLRGNHVFVMFWGTTCASCIQAMPDFHKIYLKYRDRGFEVVSIAFDADTKRRLVDRVVHENDLAWITLNGEGYWNEFNTEYGFGNIIPQYFLLDERGLLIADKQQLSSPSDLDDRLSNLLRADGFGKH